MIEILKADITKLKVDAVVNAANKFLAGGGGVDGAIHNAAGPELLKECLSIGGCPSGEIRVTSAYNLPSKFVVHAVGPIWRGGNDKEEDLLTSCYKSTMEWAVKNDIKTIAFPNISTGVYGFPKEKAAQIAIDAVQKSIVPNLKVIFCCFDEENYQIYKDFLKK